MDFSKLTNFKGSVLKPLKVPTSYRSYAATCRKIIKLHLRLHSDEVFFPELVDSLKKVAKVLHYVGRTEFKDKADNDLLDYLEEISSINIERWLQFKHQVMARNTDTVIVEESRDHVKGTRCSMCRVHLEFPSYVIRRNETEVLHKSREIGIKCLRSQQAKLSKFLDSPQIVAVLNTLCIQEGVGELV